MSSMSTMLPELKMFSSYIGDSAWLLKTTFLTVLLSILGISFLMQQARIRARYAHLPSMPTSAVVGNFLGHMEHFWLSGTHLHVTVFFANIAIGITKIVHEMKEGLFYFRIGPFRHIVACFSAKTAEAILCDTKNISKAVEYEFIKPWLGNGLLTGGGPHWKKHRKLLTPTFHFAILNKFIPVMNQQLKTLVSIVESKMDPKTGKAIVEDMRPVVTNCTVDIICQTAMGIQVNAQKSWINWEQSGADHGKKTPESEYADAVRSFLDIVLHRFVSPWLYLDFFFRLFPSGRQCAAHVKTMHNFTNNVILQRKTEMEKKFDYSLSVEESIKHISEGCRMDFLDLLLVYHLKGANDFDLISIREEVDTFMFGGHDTTSTTLHFALLLLGLNLDKQALIHEELDDIFDDDFERDITADDCKQMPYLEMCIKEVLRLYPPAAFFARTISEDFKCDKYLVPSGTTFLVLSYAIHRDPEVYEKPEHFIPERFAPNSIVLRNPFAFIPFSAGPRNCIGQKFANMELKIFLATILRRYKIRSLTKQENILLDFAIISKSHTPIKMEFTRRDSGC